MKECEELQPRLRRPLIPSKVISSRDLDKELMLRNIFASRPHPSEVKKRRYQSPPRWNPSRLLMLLATMSMSMTMCLCGNKKIMSLSIGACGFVSPSAVTSPNNRRMRHKYSHSIASRTRPLSRDHKSTLTQRTTKSHLKERTGSSENENAIPLPSKPTLIIYNNVTLKNETVSTTATTIVPEYMTPPRSPTTTVMIPSLSMIRQFFQETFFMGIDPSPDVVAIATIYFVEGALGLARLAQTYLLKDELHLGPAELSALTGIFTLPWTIKPLYGFLSDGFPLWGYRRRSYLILAGLTGCFSYSLVGNQFWGLLDSKPDWKIPATVVSLVVSSACIAFSDVVADGIVVQKTRDSNDPKIAGGLQSLCWGSAAVGGLLSAYFSGSLLEVMKPQDVFVITAILPFLVATIALLINEKPQPRQQQKSMVSTLETDESSSTVAIASEENTGVQAQIDALWSAIKQPSIYKPALFLFLWQSTPTSDGAMFFFMTEDLKFGPEFLGRVRVVTAVASLFGVWLYNQYLKSKPIKDILFWSSIVSTPLGLLNLLLISHVNRDLGIPDTWFVFGDDVVLSVLGEIAFLPTLVLAARLCPPGVEAVLFATLMSINNGAGTLGTELGAGLTKWLGITESNFDNLALLSIVCNLTSLYPLLFIGWLDEVGSVSEKEIEDAETISVIDTTTSSTNTK